MLEGVVSKARAKLQRHVTNIENRTDLTPDQKVSQIIVVFSTVCAAIAVQPIPFADFFILTPLQAFMGTRISAIRGISMSEKESSDLIKELVGVVGMGMLAQQLGIAAAKIFWPFFGGIATVPVVFSITFAMGKVMDVYFTRKATGRTASPDELKRAWQQAKKDGMKQGKQRESEIKREGLD
jgi:uncharacterized protein (DUF697 family)